MIDRGALGSEAVDLLYGGLQNGGDFIDEGAGAPGAASVHAHVADLQFIRALVLAEEQHLRVLPAKFNGGTHVLVKSPEGDGVCHHLLRKIQIQKIRHGLRAGSCHGDADLCIGILFPETLQRRADTVQLGGTVPAVIVIDDLPVFRNHRSDLRGRGTDIDPDQIFFRPGLSGTGGIYFIHFFLLHCKDAC